MAEEGVQQKEYRRGINYDIVYLDKYNEILYKGGNDNNSIDFLKAHFHVLNIKKKQLRKAREAAAQLLNGIVKLAFPVDVLV